MKRILIIVIVFIMASSLVACGEADQTSALNKNVQIDEFIENLTKAGFPISDIEVYDEKTDPNELLGRPGQYIAKFNFSHTSEYNAYKNLTIEIFNNSGDAKKRAEQIETIIDEGLVWKQYVYLKDCYLLRLPISILPEEAEMYENAFNSIINRKDVQTYSGAPDLFKETMQDPSLGTIDKPAGVDDNVVIATSDGVIQITLIEVSRGAKGEQLIAESSTANELDNEKEAIVAKFSVENLKSTDREFLPYIDSYNFEFSRADGTVYDEINTFDGFDIFFELDEGKKDEFSLAVEIDQNENDIFFVYKSYDVEYAEQENWFDISGGGQAIIEADPTPELTPEPTVKPTPTPFNADSFEIVYNGLSFEEYANIGLAKFGLGPVQSPFQNEAGGYTYMIDENKLYAFSLDENGVIIEAEYTNLSPFDPSYPQELPVDEQNYIGCLYSYMVDDMEGFVEFFESLELKTEDGDLMVVTEAEYGGCSIEFQDAAIYRVLTIIPNLSSQTPEPTPTPEPTDAPEISGTITLPDRPTDSTEDVYALIQEYAENEWPGDSDMIEWEYDQQVDAYNYCSSLPDSDIKSYALKEWQAGKYTIWTMVEWEYDQQTAAYNYMQTIEWSGKQAAISYWTKGGYVIWTMVQWEYENQ